MSFSKKLKYFLVHTLMLTNKQADFLIKEGDVEVDGLKIFENCLLNDLSEIKIKGEVKRVVKKLIYLKFNKPVGFQSSLNTNVANNLSAFFKQYPTLFIAGRLDKNSEGLLLLSNDGKWVEDLCNPKFEKEKEYLVTLDKKPGFDLTEAFQKGIFIGSHLTKPSTCRILENNVVNIILREGKNRQIRRMCTKMGYQVMVLKRHRVGNFLLEGLEAGQLEEFEV